MEAKQRVSFSQPVGATGSWISLDWVWGQYGLQSESQETQSYIKEIPVSNKQT